MIRTRLLLSALAASAAIAIAGCGGGDSSSDLAGFASPGALVFAEGELMPSGELKSNADSVASRIAGVDNLGDLIVEKLEDNSGEDGKPVDFAREVEPWLGERGALAFDGVEDGDPTELVMAIETTDPAAAREFVDDRAEESKPPARAGSYEGVEFKVGGSEGQAVGVVEDFLVVAEDEGVLRAAVDAWQGDALADESRFQDAISAASDGSLADVYLDLGGLLEESKGNVDPQALEVLQSSGVALEEATAVASVIPGSDEIQIDLSSDLGGAEPPPGGDASALIGTLPGNSFAALGFSEFGDQLKEALDELDESGVPGQLPPNQLKSSLASVGIEVDKIADSLEDGAIFARGDSKRSLGGAMVLTASSGEAAQAIEDFSELLTKSATAGVTAVSSDGASGVLIHASELGDRPIAMLSEGDRVAIGYGLAPALAGLQTESGKTLSSAPSYKAAVAALGKTPISGFVDGPAALGLAEALVPRSEEGFWEARPYLKKIEFVAMGSGEDDDVATAKLIVGLEK
jgi:hypothetical protein